jgi:hypothetical protein
MTEDDVRHRLTYLHLHPFPLFGCARRNVWTRKAMRSDVGAAVLSFVGSKQPISWEGEVVDVVVAPDGKALCLWRPGPWRPWWIDEALLLAGMVRARSNIRAEGVFVLHEVDGETHVRYIETPVAEASRVYEAALAGWRSQREVPPRWNRRTERAQYVCPKCPVRHRCEAVDLEHGATHDWL